MTELALGLLVLGIVVSIGATILTGFRDARLTDLTVASTNGETITPDDSGIAFANKWFVGANYCQNSTTGPSIHTGNYTTAVDAFGTGTLTNLTSEFSTASWRCNYTWYNTSRADWSLPNNASIGLGEYGNWFKIIVIVGIAAVVLSLIFLSFGKRNAGVQAY